MRIGEQGALQSVLDGDDDRMRRMPGFRPALPALPSGAEFRRAELGARPSARLPPASATDSRVRRHTRSRLTGFVEPMRAESPRQPNQSVDEKSGSGRIAAERDDRHQATTGRGLTQAANTNRRLWSTYDSVLRAPVAAASTIAAAAHLPVTGEHLTEVPYVGVLFLLLEVGYLLLAAALCWRPARAVYLGVAAISAAALLALVYSRVIGLPMLTDDIGEWSEPLVTLSLLAEWIALIGGITASSRTTPRSQFTQATAMSVGAVLLAVGIALVSLATVEREPAAPGTGDTNQGGMDMGLPQPNAAPTPLA